MKTCGWRNGGAQIIRLSIRERTVTANRLQYPPSEAVN